MTREEILKKSVARLKNSKIPYPELEAEIILSFVLKKSREFILTFPEQQLSKAETRKVNKLINKRIKNWPLAYLLGYKYFYKYQFKINKHTLIPRPETELMVSQALKLAKKLGQGIFIDIGTGSGCVIISLIKTLFFSSEFRSKKNNFSFYAIDCSKKALKISQKNAKSLQVDKYLRFFQSNLLNIIFKKKKQLFDRRQPLIILANLPYLTNKELKNSSIKKEPKLALFGGREGLKYYRKLIKQIKKLNDSGFKTFSFFEINPEQSRKIRKIINNSLNPDDLKIKKDLSGNNRLIKIISGHG